MILNIKKNDFDLNVYRGGMKLTYKRRQKMERR